MTFTLPSAHVRFYEVEIELKEPRDSSVLSIAITRRCGAGGYGKLPTGKANEALSRTGALNGLFGPDDVLMSSAYARIEEWLRSATPGDK